MATVLTEYAQKQKQLPYMPESGCGMVAELIYKPTAAQAIGANDVLIMGKLPPRCKALKMELYTTAIAAGTANVGFVNNTNNGLSQAFISAANVAAEAFTATQVLGALKLLPSDDALNIGVHFPTALTIPANAEIHVLVYYRDTVTLTD